MTTLRALSDPRVPEERWPMPSAIIELVKCGPNGRLIELIFPNQQVWGVYEQSGHAGAAVVLATTPDGEVYIPLVSQWRPTDIESIELPAGNIGIGPVNMLQGIMEEIAEEVGTIEVEDVYTCKGFSHNSSREVAAGGGPKCFFLYIMQARIPDVPKPRTFVKGDEKVLCRWYTVEQVRNLVRSGRIGEIVTCFFLSLARVVDVTHFGLQGVNVPFQQR